MEAYLKHILVLKAKFRVDARILIEKMGVKRSAGGTGRHESFQEPSRPIFFVDFHVQFEWRGNTG